jgi:hypothetical protein
MVSITDRRRATSSVLFQANAGRRVSPGGCERIFVESVMNSRPFWIGGRVSRRGLCLPPWLASDPGGLGRL